MSRTSAVSSFFVEAGRKARDPVVHTDLLQIVKTTVAAVMAWVLAVRVFDLDQPFLAPWAALLTVHATVYRTLSRGVQQVAATVLGVLLAFAVASLLGVNFATLGFTLLLSLFLGGMAVLRAEGMTVATTALIVLVTGYSDDGTVLVARLLDTAVGIVSGVLINFVVFPPLADRSAARQVDKIDDQIGDLLTRMCGELRQDGQDLPVEDWVDRTRDIDHEIDHAWTVVSDADESLRFNLRRWFGRGRRKVEHADVLRRLEQAVAETRSMARTLGRSAATASRWDPHFRDAWLATLSAAGEAITGADPAGVSRVADRLDALVEEMSTHELAGKYWPTYGALVTNLRNIVVALDDVAAAQPISGR